MTRRIFTLAYPQISRADQQLIEAFRAKYDEPYKDVVRAHFTMVFGCADMDQDNYLAHVEAVASKAKSVRFHCRYAMLGADDEADIAYVFLVPDEGYSDLSMLHDRLYTGLLASRLRLDIAYVPHITIATLADRDFAKSLCDGLNVEGVSVAGHVDALTVSAMIGGKIEDIARFALAG